MKFHEISSLEISDFDFTAPIVLEGSSGSDDGPVVSVVPEVM